MEQGPGAPAVIGDLDREPVRVRRRAVALPERQGVGAPGESDGLADQPRVLIGRVAPDVSVGSAFPGPHSAGRVILPRLAMPLIGVVAGRRRGHPVPGQGRVLEVLAEPGLGADENLYRVGEREPRRGVEVVSVPGADRIRRQVDRDIDDRPGVRCRGRDRSVVDRVPGRDRGVRVERRELRVQLGRGGPVHVEKRDPDPDLLARLGLSVPVVRRPDSWRVVDLDGLALDGRAVDAKVRGDHPRVLRDVEDARLRQIAAVGERVGARGRVEGLDPEGPRPRIEPVAAVAGHGNGNAADRLGGGRSAAMVQVLDSVGPRNRLRAAGLHHVDQLPRDDVVARDRFVDVVDHEPV